MSGSDPSNTTSSPAEAVGDRPSEAVFEADLAALAARFAAESGGGLSAELSADLALEIVLNEIVEQACLATGASGAAIVLASEGEMVCRATSGSAAPGLGSRLDTTGGLSGECCRTRRTVWCDDAAADQRADVEASRQLGVRSVVVMPLLRQAELVGVIELFSTRPYAFGIRDERTLEILADRAVSNLEHATRPLELQTPGPAPELTSPELEEPPEPDDAEPDDAEAHRLHEQILKELASRVEAPPSEPAEESALLEEHVRAVVNEIPHAELEPHPRPRRDVVVWALAGAALTCAILLGVVLGRRWGAEQAVARARRSIPALVAPVAPKITAPVSSSAADAKLAVAGAAKTTPRAEPAKAASPIPPGGLLVLEDDKEVFRQPPAARPNRESAKPEPAIETATAVEPESVKPPSASSRVLRRVEPEYPEAARQQGIQGTVVLDVHIAADGAVESLRVVSGPPLLADAATAAVKQWKFRPERVQGRPVEMQTEITLNFRLPQ